MTGIIRQDWTASNGFKPYWIGLQDSYGMDFATWESGQERSLNNINGFWCSGEPNNNNGNEDCVENLYGWCMNDDNCKKAKRFLCQKRPKLFNDCGGTYSSPSGILTSPSYPNHYPELANCVYLITEPYGTYVNFSFLTLDIDCREGSFASDFIEMRDGNAEDSPLMAKFCGNGSNVPNFMQTSQNYLRIR